MSYNINKKEYFMSMPAKNLKLDNKKRITLGKIAPNNVSSYDVELKDNGVIVLYPKVEIPAEELWIFQNKEVANSIKQGIDDAKNGKVSELSEDFWD
jgi:hypothetical protein